MTWPRPNRYCDGILWRPSIMQSRLDCLGFNLKYFRPFSYTPRFTVNGDNVIRASVAGLFLSRCPADIARFIVSIIVDTIKGQTGRWSQSYFRHHVGYRGNTKLDAPASISIISFVLWIGATFQRQMKDIKFSRLFADRKAVSDATFLGLFQAEASARGSVRASQIARRRDRPVSAITSTQPQNQLTGCLGINTDNKQSTKTPSGKITKIVSFWGKRVKRYVKVQCRHIDLLSRLVCLGSQCHAIDIVGRFHFTIPRT